MKRKINKTELEKSRAYQNLDKLQQVLDRYYLDGLIGLIPWGIGDFLTASVSMFYVWFSITKIKSTELTLAIIHNMLKDVALGLIPFFVGDIIDFFFLSNRKNMEMIRGFVAGDQATITNVRRKATQSLIMIIVFLLLIIFLIWLIIKMAQWAIGFVS